MAKFIPVEPEKWAEMVKAQAENARLKAEVEQSKRINTELLVLSERQASDIRRLTKAVMHSPAAQLKLKELEGKTTFDEINPKGGQP